MYSGGNSKYLLTNFFGKQIFAYRLFLAAKFAYHFRDPGFWLPTIFGTQNLHPSEIEFSARKICLAHSKSRILAGKICLPKGICLPFGTAKIGYVAVVVVYYLVLE
jgi:hypothetical protein